MKTLRTSDQCRAVASEYAKLAEQAADPVRKGEYEMLEIRWLKLTTKYDLQERGYTSNVLPFTGHRKSMFKLR